jgi:hypothetical protein
MAKTMSQPEATARGEAATFAPMPANRLHASADLFQTVSACPDFTRLAAIALPMIPSPTNPTFMVSPVSKVW